MMLRAIESGRSPREYGENKTPPTHPSADPPPAPPSYPVCEHCGLEHWRFEGSTDPAYCHLAAAVTFDA
jgi:hypothetical protein